MSNTTVKSSDFVRKAEEIWSVHKGCTYRNGSSGQKENGVYYCDCRGYLLWTLRSLGISASSAGTNWMIRNQMREVSEVSSVSDLRVGMAVFKSRKKGSSGWSLPDKYRKGGKAYDERFGELDAYHVGVVVQTSLTLIIRHCTNGGIKTATTLTNWTHAGWLQWVREADTASQNASEASSGTFTHSGIVTAQSGSTVNLRKAMSTKSQLVERVPVGTAVGIISETNGWCRVSYKKWSGYMMSCYVDRG